MASLQAACLSSRRPGTISARNHGAEDAFFRAASAFETFLTEWLVRCISFDTSMLATTYAARAASETQVLLWANWPPAKRLWTSAAPPAVDVQLSIEAKPSLDATRSLLGRPDDNFTFGGASDFKRTVQELVSVKYASRISAMTQKNDRFFDGTVAIRNVIAHRSDRAVSRMNQVLNSSHLPVGVRTSRTVTASGVGYYLRTQGSAQRPRCEVYLEELAEIAHVLAPRRGRRPVICP